MSGDRVAELMFLGLALTLPLSALISRRIPPRQTARMVTIWVVIIVGAALLITVARGGTPWRTSLDGSTGGSARRVAP